MNHFKTFARVAAAAAIVACASTGTNAGSRAQSDRILASEIATTSTTNAWDLIQRLRPNWLKNQNVGSIGGGASTQLVVVYLDGTRLGDTSSLRTLSVSGISSLQWLDAARASTLLPGIGSEPISGAIVIKTH